VGEVVAGVGREGEGGTEDEARGGDIGVEGVLGVEEVKE
jgi:hypothetical protein